MKKIAVFPGSFDPVTIGHQDIVKRAVKIFDEVILGVGINAKKKSLYPLETRMEWLSEVFQEYETVRVKDFRGLTVDFCRQEKAHFLIRGLRTSQDFVYERSFALMSYQLAPDIETVFLVTAKENLAISSTNVREILMNRGDIKPFVPLPIGDTVIAYNKQHLAHLIQESNS